MTAIMVTRSTFGIPKPNYSNNVIVQFEAMAKKGKQKQKYQREVYIQAEIY